jgi:hypothetical protein
MPQSGPLAVGTEWWRLELTARVPGRAVLDNARGTTVDKQTKHEILVVTLATLSPLPLLMGVVALVLH